jgi:hypothetical protein
MNFKYLIIVEANQYGFLIDKRGNEVEIYQGL